MEDKVARSQIARACECKAASAHRTGDAPKLCLTTSEHDTIDAVPESERLARRFFAAHEQHGSKAALDLFHPEIEMVLKTRRPGDVLRGRDEVARFIDEIEGTLYELVAEVYRPLDDHRIVVEGRIRWVDDERVLRDDPVIWALELRDGLIWRSAPASSTIQAETILEASRNADC